MTIILFLFSLGLVSAAPNGTIGGQPKMENCGKTRDIPYKDWRGKKVIIYFLTYFLFSKKFRKYLILLPAFDLIMWLMKLPKNFEKIAILKIGELVSF